jgi:hypothetical protein
MAEPTYVLRDAEFSPCRLYRYRLRAVWDRDLARVAFVMLNPSTADENVLDPTLRRCLGFAQAWGFGGFEIGNLFAFRSTDPLALHVVPDPVGPDNNRWLQEIARACEIVVCGWGNMARVVSFRDDTVRRLLAPIRPLAYLRLNARGQPAHPLYQPKDLRPTFYPRHGGWGVV